MLIKYIKKVHTMRMERMVRSMSGWTRTLAEESKARDLLSL
jgi:hypothetical protein